VLLPHLLRELLHLLQVLPLLLLQVHLLRELPVLLRLHILQGLLLS
jgi:hypothetical protein